MKLKENIYSVGVLNPQLRVFDIIMETKYGTTYNAYLVKGTEKTALIETVHSRFFDEYMEHIRQVCDPADIDYLIMNHTEPDHSGAVENLLGVNPNLTIVSTNSANKFLHGICNRDFNAHVVKDGEELNLGGLTLQFLVAPFLHWPDSMFTYVKEEQLLFSCDVFGCHYCEPTMLNTKIHYPQRYQDSFKYYFDCIFGPFKQHVLNGLSKLEPLAIDTICPSHGPVLVDGIDGVMEQYRQFSSDVNRENNPKQVAIVYVSAYGCTRALAEQAAKTVEAAGLTAQLIDVIAYDGNPAAQVMAADGVLFGSPTINRDALKPIWDVISGLDAVNCAKKPCGLFGSYGWSGEALGMLKERLTTLKLNVIGDGVKANFVPSEAELKAMEDYTKEFLAAL